MYHYEFTARHALPYKLFALLTLSGLATSPAAEIEQNWHQWRGPEATGVSRTATPPLEWSAESNIQWKVAIAGQGSSTPIIWGNRLYVLTVIDTGNADPQLPAPEDQPERPFGITYPNTIHQYVVLCLNRETGQELWRRVAIERVPHEGHHGDNDFASASPTTDGQRLYVWFGSAGMYCYDLDGQLLWERNLGDVATRLSFGEGSSPTVHGDRLVITRDNETQSTITVMDTASGAIVWQHDRDEPSCWATPIVVDYADRKQVITNAHKRVRSYDLADGSLIWECGGQVSNVTPSPVATATSVICMSGYRGSIALSLPLAATGDLTDSDQIEWSISGDTPYVPSPLLYDGFLYFNRQNVPILTCLDVKTGNALIERTRMPGLRAIYASPVGAVDRVYYVGRGGTTLVLAKGPEFKVLATNQLDDQIDASPALAGSQIFLRGEKYLYCIRDAGDRQD